MDYSKFLRKEVTEYINANLKGDLHSLLLKRSPFEDITMAELGQQIQGRQTALRKFPSYIKDGVVFPPKLNLEQTSSEATAKYKASQITGETWLDLTSGLGIDSFYMSENFRQRTLVEQNSELVPIIKHNFVVWDRAVEIINNSLENCLDNFKDKYDLVYLDPARRDNTKRKVFLLEDLSPNILEIQDRILALGNQVVIKLSPLIDLTYLLEVLPKTHKIDIIALKNEVKEVLVYMSNDQPSAEVNIKCINLESEESDFEFNLNSEQNTDVEFSPIKDYLYIPNNAITKAGAFKSVAKRYNLYKLHPNTHFYTSDQYVKEFPGRHFRIEEITAKDIEKGAYYNIVSKNYPVKPEDLKKKFKTKDGGEKYLIFTQDVKGKKILKAVPVI